MLIPLIVPYWFPCSGLWYCLSLGAATATETWKAFARVILLSSSARYFTRSYQKMVTGHSSSSLLNFPYNNPYVVRGYDCTATCCLMPSLRWHYLSLHLSSKPNPTACALTARLLSEAEFWQDWRNALLGLFHSYATCHPWNLKHRRPFPVQTLTRPKPDSFHVP